MSADDLPAPIDAAAPPVQEGAARIGTFGLIVGGMKCGSTSLYDYLVAHPQVAACRIKEPNFFSTSKGHDQPERYAALWRKFDPARHRVALEASVNYAKLPRYPRTTRAIADYRRRFGSDFRFLYIMRDPVARAESHIAHNISKGRCSHEDYSGMMRLALDTSRYAMQIERYHKLAGPEGLLLLSLDDLKSDPIGLLSRCTRFLGLDDFAFEIRPPSNTRSAENDSASFRLSEVERAWIRAALAEDMAALALRYGFDVSPWGFKAARRGKRGGEAAVPAEAGPKKGRGRRRRAVEAS